MFRQGDVLLIPVDREIPEGAKRVPRDQGRIVLAYGEVTGHAHALQSRHAVLFEIGEGRLLRVERKSTLTHEEHSAITLAPGVYEVRRQREYVAPEIERRVAD